MLSAARIKYRTESTIDADLGVSYMTLAGTLIGVLVLFAAGLVVYNIFKIAVTKRIKNYGILRAIGAEKKASFIC